MVRGGDPLTELRRQIEATAQNTTLPRAERIGKLRLLRERLNDALGTAERYLDDAVKEQEAQFSAQMDAELAARENADAREELLRQGVATEEQLDSWGYYSHERLDELAERHASFADAISSDAALKGAVANASGLAHRSSRS